VNWRDRLRQMTLAGGAISLAACGGGSLPSQMGQAGQTGSNFQCGNANPDPCICGRPDASQGARAQCDGEIACQAGGGVWNPTYMLDSTGTTVPPHCEVDGGAAPDAAPTPDAGSDGA
jgi:hypothetical protein